jgi:hypothetical protein
MESTFNEEYRNIFTNTYSTTFNENVKLKTYLTESKKRFPHLNESFLIENKELLENVRKYDVSDRDIMDAFHVDLVQARNIHTSFRSFAIAEHYAKNESDVELFNEKVNSSCMAILLVEAPKFDPEATLDPSLMTPQKLTAVKKASQKAQQPAPEATPKQPEEISPEQKDVEAPKVDPSKAEEKKKGFLTKVKEFLVKSGKIVVAVGKSSAFYKALAMGAVMVILGVIAGALGGWFAIGFAGIKGILGLFSIYKGSKELIKTSDFAQGKKGIEGVKEWINSSKDPKNATKIIVAIAKIAMGTWGASSAIGQVMTEITVMDSSTSQPSTQTSPEVPKSEPTTPAPTDAVATNTTVDHAKGQLEKISKIFETNPTQGKTLFSKWGEALATAQSEGKITDEQVLEMLKGKLSPEKADTWWDMTKQSFEMAQKASN